MGLSNVEFGKKVGVSKGGVTQWLTGQSFPSTEALLTIATESGVSLGVLSDLHALRDPKVRARLGEIEFRFRRLPESLRGVVLHALAVAEDAAAKLPPQMLGPTVSDDKLHGWGRPDGEPEANGSGPTHKPKGGT